MGQHTRHVLAAVPGTQGSNVDQSCARALPAVAVADWALRRVMTQDLVAHLL